MSSEHPRSTDCRLETPGAVEYLFEVLHGVARVAPAPVFLEAPRAAQLARAVNWALIDPGITAWLFLVCARGFFELGRTRDVTRAAVEKLARATEQATRSIGSLDHRVASTIARLEEAGTNSGSLSEDDCARAVGVHRAHLGRLVRSESGFTFTEWRLVPRMRPAVRQLALTADQIKGIAADTGFGSAASLDHAFRSMFGVTPGQFRSGFRPFGS